MNCLLTRSYQEQSIHTRWSITKPIAEPTSFSFPSHHLSGGAAMVWQAICGKPSSSLCHWVEIPWCAGATALPSIDKAWSFGEKQALLFWGGDPLYLSYWMRQPA
jgi:dipeptidase E